MSHQERSTAKNYCPVSLTSEVSKVFEKLVSNRIADHLEKWNLRSIEDLLTVVSNIITRAFNRSGATRAVALDISKAFDRFWHTDLLRKLKCYGISGQIFDLILSFLSNRRLQVVVDGKSSQEYSVNAGIPQALSLVLHFSYYILMTFLLFYADDTTLYFKCDQASDLRKQLELASELESDVQDTGLG